MSKVTAPALLVASLLALVACSAGPAPPQAVANPFASATYHAVVLTTGQVYYGKIAGVQDEFLKLTDVYYIVGQQAQPPEPAKGSLIRRGKELHGPDHMLVNRAHVLLVEPVSPDSRIGVLIREAAGPAR